MATILVGSLPGVLVGTALDRRACPRTRCAPCSAACCSARALGVLKKAGVDVPPAVLVGVPVAVGAFAWLLQRGAHAA